MSEECLGEDERQQRDVIQTLDEKNHLEEENPRNGTFEASLDSDELPSLEKISQEFSNNQREDINGEMSAASRCSGVRK